MLARMIAAHDEIAFASDPFATIFKSIRNSVANDSQIELDVESPLADYYYQPDGIQLLNSIRECSLADLGPECDMATLAMKIAEASLPYSPDLSPHLSRINGDSFQDVLSHGLRLIHEVYGSHNTSITGFKEVWSTEFIPSFLRAFPQSRAICLVRDPRAVYLSKWKQKKRYPLLFMARQWRKLAALSWLCSQDPTLGGRVMIMRYEDLVTNPERAVDELASFVGVDDACSMADPEKWSDGGGGSWRQNTSFGSGAKGFDSNAVNRWISSLPEADARLIESICSPEMHLFGYEPLHEPWSSCQGELNSPSQVPPDRLANWIAPYVDETRSGLAGSYLLEWTRWKFLTSTASCEEQIQSLLSLSPEIFAICRSTIKGKIL